MPAIPVPPDRRRARRVLRLVALVAAVALVVVFGRTLGRRFTDLATWIDQLGAWGPVAYVGLYAIAVVAFAPGSVLTLAAGALFGLARGSIVAFAGAALGATLAFLVSRRLGRGLVEARLARDGRFEAVDRAIGVEGRRIVFLLRLSPLVPFNALNYALGLTRVSLRDYLITLPGMLPVTFLYVYYGKLAGDLASLAGGQALQRGPAYYVVLALGLGATALATALVTRLARRALARARVDALTEPARH
jgi:uncharacterized membrane protein YdjX (TVP38/TMEM64 family)